MTIPVKNFGDFTVCFEAEPEDTSLRRHFIHDCGWTEAQYRRIKHHPWFSAKVSIWKAGKELAIEYLGCCCYETEEEFYTTYEGDYFADMVWTCAQEIKDEELLKMVETWRTELHALRLRPLPATPEA